MPELPDKSTRFFITLAVMAATLIQVLDMTIVNVALPQMRGELGATTDEVSWVLTSYLVSSAIFMPLTGYFTDVLGRKRYLLGCIGGFLIASALCGLSTSITEIVIFRLLQGAFGAALVPLSQAIMTDAYPVEERGSAMAIWGLGVMVGPVLGPTLGGWLTDFASWRWTFFINVPVGALSLFLALRFVPDTPKVPRRMDWAGLVLLSLGIAGTQYVLDRGNQRDWFNALDIQVAAWLAVLGVIGFALRSMHPKPGALFNIHIFKDRNFAMSCLVMLILGLGLFGGMIVQPILMEGLLGYPIVTTGLLMAPRGVASAIAMLVVGRLLRFIDARLLVAAGMIVSAAGSFGMEQYSLQINNFWLVWPAVLQGLGMGLIFVPLSTMAYATLPRAQIAEGAGLYSLMRTIGSAIGISIITTLMSRETQVVWNTLGGFINRYNPAFSHYLAPLHLAPDDPRALQMIAGEIARQAQMVAMLDAFKVIAWSFVFMIPLVLLLRKKNAGAAPVTVVHGE